MLLRCIITILKIQLVSIISFIKFLYYILFKFVQFDKKLIFPRFNNLDYECHTNFLWLFIVFIRIFYNYQNFKNYKKGFNFLI